MTSPQIAQGTLTLLNRNVETELVKEEPVMPYGLIIGDNNHECPLLSTIPEEPEIFVSRALYD